MYAIELDTTNNIILAKVSELKPTIFHFYLHQNSVEIDYADSSDMHGSINYKDLLMRLSTLA